PIWRRRTKEQAAVAARGGLLRGAGRRGHRAEHDRAVPRQRLRGICRADSADRRGRRRSRRPVVGEGVMAVLSVVPSCVAMLHFRRRPIRLPAPASAALMLALALLLLAAAAPAARAQSEFELPGEVGRTLGD